MTPEVEGYGCTVDELMVVAFSRAMDNDTRAFNGAVSFIPVCGYLLARRTHAPNLVWAASSPRGWWDGRPGVDDSEDLPVEHNP